MTPKVLPAVGMVCTSKAAACNAGRRAGGGLLAFLVALLVPAVGAQPASTLAELKRLDERLCGQPHFVTRREAKIAGDRLAEWHLDPDKLELPDRLRLLRIRLYVALGHGRAGEALEAARQLFEHGSGDARSLEAVYIAAAAGGDAKLGLDALRKLARRVTGDQRRRIALRKRWLRTVGQAAPDVLIRTDDLSEYRTRRRGGKLLLLDFWNLTTPPPEDAVAAVVALYKLYRDTLYIQFVGIDADAEQRIAEARRFAQEHGMVWKQCYEGQAVGAPLTHKAFGAGKPPWQVLIDTMGYIRAVGDARTPEFQFAVLAAINEARGDAPAVLVRDRRGKQPERRSESIKAAKPPESGQTAVEKPGNAEASRLLTLARTYLKTGRKSDAKALFERIVREFPGTPEARQAQEYLDSVWP